MIEQKEIVHRINTERTELIKKIIEHCKKIGYKSVSSADSSIGGCAIPVDNKVVTIISVKVSDSGSPQYLELELPRNKLRFIKNLTNTKPEINERSEFAWIVFRNKSNNEKEAAIYFDHHYKEVNLDIKID